MRKGQYVLGYKGVYFLIAAFLLTFIFFYVYGAFNEYQTEKLTCNEDVLNELMIAKVLYSPCFTYYDEATARSIPGTIDLSKFTQATLKSCFTVIDQKVNISVMGTTIGRKIYEAESINKTIWLYKGEEKIPTTIQFIFEEPAC